MNNDVSNNTFIWSVFFTNKPKTKKFIAIPITVNGKNLLNEVYSSRFLRINLLSLNKRLITIKKGKEVREIITEEYKLRK
jgi:hypothetical protein